VYVYIEEAHADDEWPLSKEFKIKQHKTKEERVTAAQRMVGEFGSEIAVLVDSMANDFNRQFSVWPERWFLLDTEGKLIHVAYPTTEFGFERKDIEIIITNNLEKKSSRSHDQ